MESKDYAAVRLLRLQETNKNFCAADGMRQNVMAVTAIRGFVSFLVGGLRDRHLTEATVVLGVVVANRSGDHTHSAARRVGWS